MKLSWWTREERKERKKRKEERKERRKLRRKVPADVAATPKRKVTKAVSQSARRVMTSSMPLSQSAQPMMRRRALVTANQTRLHIRSTLHVTVRLRPPTRRAPVTKVHVVIIRAPLRTRRAALVTEANPNRLHIPSPRRLRVITAQERRAPATNQRPAL